MVGTSYAKTEHSKTEHGLPFHEGAKRNKDKGAVCDVAFDNHQFLIKKFFFI